LRSKIAMQQDGRIKISPGRHRIQIVRRKASESKVQSWMRCRTRARCWVRPWPVCGIRRALPARWPAFALLLAVKVVAGDLSRRRGTSRRGAPSRAGAKGRAIGPVRPRVARPWRLLRAGRCQIRWS